MTTVTIRPVDLYRPEHVRELVLAISQKQQEAPLPVNDIRVVTVELTNTHTADYVEHDHAGRPRVIKRRGGTRTIDVHESRALQLERESRAGSPLKARRVADQQPDPQRQPPGTQPGEGGSAAERQAQARAVLDVAGEAGDGMQYPTLVAEARKLLGNDWPGSGRNPKKTDALAAIRAVAEGREPDPVA